MSLDRTERTGLPRHDSGINRAVDKGVWAEQLEQDSRDRAAHSRERTAGTGQLGQNSWDKTARTGKPGQENREGKSERQMGKYSQDRKQMRNSQTLTARRGTTVVVERGYLGKGI